MSYVFRAESISDENIIDKYVNSSIDQRVLQKLMSDVPILIEGSRGTGKTMLMKVAKMNLTKNFKSDKILPLYVTFQKTMLVKDEYFVNWMLSKILSELKKELKNNLNLMDASKQEMFMNLFGIKENNSRNPVIEKIDTLVEMLEDSWKDENNTSQDISTLIQTDIKKVDVFNEVSKLIDLVEFICEEFNLLKIYIFFDEACHNFLPYQRRTFFNLFRDLTHSKIVCKASIYPGLPSYGDSFQRFHDVEVVKINRSIGDEDYRFFMRNVVKKSIPEHYGKLEKYGELFDALIYAASGNPRILIKSLYMTTNGFSDKLSSRIVNEIIKDFYRNDIWYDHNELLDKYPGHKEIIQWGKSCIDEVILSKIIARNNGNTGKRGNYFGIDIKSTKTVRRSFDILEYSGITLKTKESYKKYMSGQNRQFTLYELNLGILLSEYTHPHIEYKEILRNLSQESRTYLTALPDIHIELVDQEDNIDNLHILRHVLELSVDKLEITHFLKKKAKEAGCNKIGEIIRYGKSRLMQVHMVGHERSSKIYDEAQSAVLEYISG